MRPELRPNAPLFIFSLFFYSFFFFLKAEFSFSSPAAKDVSSLRRGHFGWACLARTRAKFLTFSDACSSLPAGQMLHLLSIIPLMLLSACIARRVAFKWQWSSYLRSFSATTVTDGRGEWRAYSISLSIIYTVASFPSQHHKLGIKMPRQLISQARQDKSMSWIFWGILFFFQRCNVLPTTCGLFFWQGVSIKSQMFGLSSNRLVFFFQAELLFSF